MATVNSKLADVPKPTNGSDISSANILCVQNGGVTQIPGYLKKIQDIQKSVDDFKTAVFDMIYPVGSYYWSSNATNPGSIFGGTREQIKDRFVLAAGGTYTAGATGGEAAHTLSVNEMPSHSHSASTASSGNHSHTGTTNGGGGHGHAASSSAAGYHAHYLAIYRAAGNNPSGSALQFYVQNNPGHGTFNHWSSGDGNHTHDISISYVGDHAHTFTTSYVGDHTHTVMVTSTGGSEAHNNMPPYIVAYCWHRTK